MTISVHMKMYHKNKQKCVLTLLKCSLDEGKEDKVNLNCSENDQQWRAGGGGGGVRA